MEEDPNETGWEPLDVPPDSQYQPLNVLPSPGQLDISPVRRPPSSPLLSPGLSPIRPVRGGRRFTEEGPPSNPFTPSPRPQPYPVLFATDTTTTTTTTRSIPGRRRRMDTVPFGKRGTGESLAAEMAEHDIPYLVLYLPNPATPRREFNVRWRIYGLNESFAAHQVIAARLNRPEEDDQPPSPAGLFIVLSSRGIPHDQPAFDRLIPTRAPPESRSLFQISVEGDFSQRWVARRTTGSSSAENFPGTSMRFGLILEQQRGDFDTRDPPAQGYVFSIEECTLCTSISED